MLKDRSLGKRETKSLTRIKEFSETENSRSHKASDRSRELKTGPGNEPGRSPEKGKGRGRRNAGARHGSRVTSCGPTRVSSDFLRRKWRRGVKDPEQVIKENVP